MTARKFAIINVIILLACMTVYGQSPSKFKIFVYSGISLPVYPSSGFSSFLRPVPNVGVGLNFKLSSKMSISLDFNRYRFKPKSKTGWDISMGESGIQFTENLYATGFIEVDYDRNDLLLELKWSPFPIKARFSPYIIAGAGATFRRIETYQYDYYEISMLRWYKSNSVFYLAVVGLGIEYRIDDKVGIFLEACYNYSFLDQKNKNRGVIPLKLGISLGL
jgi:hypothetical protein